MIHEATATGESVEIAATNAIQMLAAPLEAEVKTDILEYPKKKVLGLFGGGCGSGLLHGGLLFGLALRVAVLCCRDKYLRAGQVEHIQLLTLIGNTGALHLVAVERFPAHEIVELRREHAAGNLPALLSDGHRG